MPGLCPLKEEIRRRILYRYYSCTKWYKTIYKLTVKFSILSKIISANVNNLWKLEGNVMFFISCVLIETVFKYTEYSGAYIFHIDISSIHNKYIPFIQSARFPGVLGLAVAVRSLFSWFDRVVLNSVASKSGVCFNLKKSMFFSKSSRYFVPFLYGVRFSMTIWPL